MARDTRDPLAILHVVLSIGETNTTYNEHCLPMVGLRDLAVCTYFRSAVVPPASIALFPGDGSFTGFFRALTSALRARHYDVIHAHSPHVAFFLLVASIVHRQAARSTIVTVHDTYGDFKLRNRLLLLPVFAGLRRVVCCGKASLASFPALYKVLAGERLCAVQNGVDLERIDRVISGTGRARTDDADFRVLAVSRMVAVKNPFTALEAFTRAADAGSHLTYLGDGPLRPTLTTRAAVSGIGERVSMPGVVSRDTVLQELLDGDLFISASRGEGLPIAVLEAMACRCPVLLSDIPPHREIADGVEFIPLVDADDAAGFAREIERFRAMPPGQRSAIGEACRRHAEERFSLSAMHAGYEDIYRRVAGRAAPAATVRAFAR